MRDDLKTVTTHYHGGSGRTHILVGNSVNLSRMADAAEEFSHTITLCIDMMVLRRCTPNFVYTAYVPMTSDYHHWITSIAWHLLSRDRRL